LSAIGGIVRCNRTTASRVAGIITMSLTDLRAATQKSKGNDDELLRLRHTWPGRQGPPRTKESITLRLL
jgi:hypothetical protein